jgi:molybdopterin/thiamine biosynthesis adenylyltransferase
MVDSRYSRNEALFGAEGQEKIAATKVAIIGVGGLGSHVAQQLAYLGVERQTPVDFDIVTSSSMNRLVGAVDTDVAAKTKKVIVAKRMIEAINPSATVEPADVKIDTPVAEAAIAGADVVFGCLDRDLPRLKLTELCSRYAKPLFDLASDTGGEEDDIWYGGRVVFANGAGCLVCRNLLDQQDDA